MDQNALAHPMSLRLRLFNGGQRKPMVKQRRVRLILLMSLLFAIFISFYQIPKVNAVIEWKFYGVFDEDTGLLKPPNERAVNVTAYYGTEFPGADTFEVNGSYSYYPSDYPLYFRFNTSEPREFWVRTDDLNGTEIYIFDTDLTTYYINFLDLAGYLDIYDIIEAQRYINGTLTIVERRKVDEEKQVVMKLKQNEKYTIILKDTTSYTWGDLAMTDDTNPQLTIKGIDFPQTVMLGYRYVRMYATRHNNGTSISSIFEDILNDTTTVNIYINYENGTNAYNNSYSTPASFNDTWTSANASLNYYVIMECTHNQFGQLDYRIHAPRVWSVAPFSIAFLWPSATITTSTLIPAFIIICVAGLFSVLNAHVGAFLMVAMAIILSWIGWISINVGILVVCLTLCFLLGLEFSKRRVFEY